MARKVVGRLGLAFILALGASAQAQAVDPAHPESSPSGGETSLAGNSRLGCGAQIHPKRRTDHVRIRCCSIGSGQRCRRMKIPTARSTPIDPHSRRPTRSSPPAGSSSSRALPSTTSRTSKTRTTAYDFPELAMRLGLMDRVEFRTFWFGQTYSQTQSRPGGPCASVKRAERHGNRLQVAAHQRQRGQKWIPTTALITSVFAPTGGTSPYSSETVDPYINLIYGWTPHREADVWRQHRVSGKTRALRSATSSTQRQLRAIPPIARRVLFAWPNEPLFSTSGIS